jgi:hypothetical protein
MPLIAVESDRAFGTAPPAGGRTDGSGRGSGQYDGRSRWAAAVAGSASASRTVRTARRGDVMGPGSSLHGDAATARVSSRRPPDAPFSREREARYGRPRDDRAAGRGDVHLGPEDEAHWGRRNNPACEANVAALVAAWREAGEPVVFVRHDWSEPGSPLRPGQPGNDFKPVLTGEPDLVVSECARVLGTAELIAALRS